jgi:hypothetical protein
LSRKGLVFITSGKRVLIIDAGVDWLEDNGWSVRLRSNYSACASLFRRPSLAGRRGEKTKAALM